MIVARRFQRRVGSPRNVTVPEARLKPISDSSAPFQPSLTGRKLHNHRAHPALKRRATVGHPYGMPPNKNRAVYLVENLNTVFDLNVSPGFRIVLGKSG